MSPFATPSAGDRPASHRLLVRQLRRVGLDIDQPPTLEQWTAFLDRVGTAYLEADQQPYLIERSLEVSSEELRTLFEARRASEARLNAIFDSVGTGLCVLTPEGLVESANPEFEEIVGTAADRLVGQLLWDVVRFEPDREGLAELTIGEFRNAMLDRVEWRSDDCELSNCSRRVAVSVVLTPLLNGERVDGAVLVVRDITERKEAQALLAWQASHDALTGIPNRSELHRRLEQAMLHGDAHGHPPALLYLDLDRFKAVNDTYGHAAGDQLLVQVTERVVAAVRGSDTVARLSGDEFAVLCEGIDEKDALIVGTRIVTSLERPFLIDGHEVGVSASVGVAFGADLRASVAAVLRAADAAMYRAKQDGRGCVRVDEHADEPAPALAGRRRDDRG